MKKLLITNLLLALACLFPPSVGAQVTVTGNLKNLGHANVTANNTFVRFRLYGYGAFSPTVDDGSGVIVSEQQDFKPDAGGNINGPLIPNDLIKPHGTFYQMCLYFQGIQFRCSSFLVNSAHSTFNINTAPSLTTVSVAGPNQLVLQTFPCVVSVAATTWTCTHNFNDSPVMVSVFDANGRQIFSDTTNVSNLNVTTLTFVTAQAGTALISHAGAITLATNQPNAVLQNPTAAPVIQGPPLTVGAPTVFTGATICRNVNNIRCVDPLNSSGWAGSDAGAWVNSALADTPNGGTVAIAPGTYTVSTQIVLTRNSSVECSPNNATVLRAGSAFNLASLFLASGINHFRLAGCVADGNRTANSNQFPLLLTVNSSNGEVRDNHFQNNLSRTILVTSGSSHIQIDNNEVDHYGLPIPASVGGEAIAIVPTGGGAGVSHIQVSNNIVHDGNLGIAVYPDSTTTSPVVDISIARNRVYATANDGILAFSTNSQGGLLTGIRIEDNEVYCTGWPANGTGFDPNCTAGFLQAGSVASSSGVGIDLNSALLDQPIIIGNRSHDNFFEGIDVTPQTATVVSTSGTTVTWVSGDPFNLAWRTGQGIIINGAQFAIASIAGTNSTLTLQSSAGTQTIVPFTGVGLSRATIIGNVSYNNGHGNGISSGAGFGSISYGDTYVGNISYGNNSAGFFDQLASFVTHTGDKAYNNNQSHAFVGGFLCQNCLNPSYINITTDDSQTVHTQPVGVQIAASRNSYINSPNLAVGPGLTGINDTGTGTFSEEGNIHRGDFVLAGGGSYHLNPSGTGGGFNLLLPALNATLTGDIASGTAPMTTALIAAGACGTTVTVPAAGVLTTDSINYSFNAAVGANPGVMILNQWPTAGNVNFAYCNPTAAGVTPPAATLNWQVTR